MLLVLDSLTITLQDLPRNANGYSCEEISSLWNLDFLYHIQNPGSRFYQSHSVYHFDKLSVVCIRLILMLSSNHCTLIFMISSSGVSIPELSRHSFFKLVHDQCTLILFNLSNNIEYKSKLLSSIWCIFLDSCSLLDPYISFSVCSRTSA